MLPPKQTTCEFMVADAVSTGGSVIITDIVDVLLHPLISVTVTS